MVLGAQPLPSLMAVMNLCCNATHLSDLLKVIQLRNTVDAFGQDSLGASFVHLGQAPCPWWVLIKA